MREFGKRSSGCNYSESFFIIVNNCSLMEIIFFQRDLYGSILSFSYFHTISSPFHSQFFLSFYMSDVKYNFCTARQMGVKVSDFSNVPNITGLWIIY